MSAEKKKIDRTKFVFKDKENETLIKNYGDLNGTNFNLTRLTNCKVFILDWTKGVLYFDYFMLTIDVY